MKTLLLVCILLLTGCATTNGEYDVKTGKVSFSTFTLWKDVEDFKLKWGDFDAKLGSSAGNGGESAVMNDVIACYLSPALCAK